MKKLTKMLLINWHYISYEVIEFENVNFLTGKNGAGKSTILDALQLLLLGNPRGNFFNKAANDKAGRSLEGYLRGEIGDDGDVGYKYLRPGRFTSYIVCEFFDTVTRKNFCIGITFDVYKDAKKDDQFFYLNAPLPENHFLGEKEIPYTISELKSYLARNNKGKYELYSGNTQYQSALLGKLGGINSKFFNLFKKAVTFTPIDDIEKFIVEYVCDVKNNIDITDMQENIRYYNNLAKQVDVMKQRQNELEEIEQVHNKYVQERTREKVQRYIILRGNQQIALDKIENLMKEIKKAKEKIEENKKRKEQIEKRQDELSIKIDELYKQRNQSDIARRSDELKKMIENLRQKIAEVEKIEQDNIVFLRNHCVQWNATIEGVTGLEYKEKIDILKDMIKYLEQIAQENVLKELDITYAENIKQAIEEMIQIANEKFYTLEAELKNKEMQKQQLECDIENLKKGMRPYKVELLQFKEELTKRLEEQVNEKVQINIFADLLEMKDIKWKNAIEGYLNTQKQYFIMEPRYYEKALAIYNELAKENQDYHSFGLVDIEKIEQENREILPNSLAEEIISENKLAQVYINYLLGRVIKCDDTSSLRKHKIAITPECMLYQGYVARKISPALYKYPTIGKKALEEQKVLKEKELKQIEEDIEKQKIVKTVMANIMKMQSFSDNDIYHLKEDCQKMQQKDQYIQEKSALQQELESLDIFWVEKIDKEIRTKEVERKQLNDQVAEIREEQAILATKIKYKEEQDLPAEHMKEQEQTNQIKLLYTPEWIEQEGEDKFGKELLRNRVEAVVYNFTNQISRTKSQIEKNKNELYETRTNYINHYQLSYSIIDDSNQEYAEDLKKIREIELPNYLDKIEDAKQKAYDQFREDFLAKLKSNIDEVKSQIKDLNEALEQYRFGSDQYRFKVSPKQEYKKFYDMIIDPMVLDGWSITTEQFKQKYNQEIKELFDKITSQDSQTISKMNEEEYEKNIKEYTDYKTYLKFDLIVIDQTGNEQRLSKTLSKKSGGETQTPFYISVLASFAQLYRTKNNDNTFRLIVFDEAFSKMDSERIEESIKLLKKSAFQSIFAAPPEKLHDIQDLVDSTLCVLNPKENCIVVRKYTNKEEW